ncbi:DUF305 domain-containing protein [Mycolicibacter terrae]|uniref:DUF305 domain-containing protein n=2 Tax=Mycolicibacter TaxID=1073531 RepID=A0A1A2Y7V6_MYCSD|nr:MULTISPECIES: DUF305 domain-containing protein [Mycolicibacter]OBH19541.1 DUF305 domain-containing protein [Mycolicibacter sinensis]OBI34179.1 DUF305 domain-containing protein [Mycolicibacter sinensis]RRR40394.1 DUF305 domain-containing protein [Mycolicibacter terrae]
MRSALAAVVALAVSIAAGGCHRAPESQPEPATSSRSAAANIGSPGDVAFLENIVVHHQQGLELTAMVPGQSTDPALVELAGQVAAQQRTELQGCQAQLLQWEAPGVPSGGRGDKRDLPGMVDQATMDTLRGLRGPAFDKLWLQSMISHHRGAIAMAHNEIQHGQSPEAISIAQSLAARQQTEIDQMNQQLGTL